MSHSVDETYTVYRKDHRRARKPHTCCACRVSIPIGHVYSYTFAVWDGHHETWDRCLRCDAIFDALVKRLSDRDEWPDEDLNCGHTWGENGEAVPPEVERLAFVSAAEMQSGAA